MLERVFMTNVKAIGYRAFCNCCEIREISMPSDTATDDCAFGIKVGL